MNCSTPGFPVLHYLLKFAQTHVHWFSDSTRPSCPLSPPSPPASIFPSIRVFSSESALLTRWPKYWSFSISPCNNIQDWFPLGLTGLISFLSKGLSIIFARTTVRKYQFFGAQPSSWSHSPYMTPGKSLHMSPPSWASLPSPLSHPSKLSQTPSWAPCVLQQLPTSYPFYTRYCIYVNATVAIQPTLSFPALSTSPFSMSVSLFLPCK